MRRPSWLAGPPHAEGDACVAPTHQLVKRNDRPPMGGSIVPVRSVPREVRFAPAGPAGSKTQSLSTCRLEQPSPESAAVPWERSRPLRAQPFPGSAGVPWGASAAVRLAHTRSLGAQPSPESAAVPWERSRPTGRSPVIVVARRAERGSLPPGPGLRGGAEVAPVRSPGGAAEPKSGQAGPVDHRNYCEQAEVTEN